MDSVFITGATGFIGSHLAAALAARGTRVTSYRRGEPLDSRTPFDVVFHLAAEIYDPLKMFDANVTLTHEILTTLRYDKCVVVGSSSELGLRTAPMRETDRPEPRSVYGATKAAATMLATGYAHEFDRDVCVARPFSVYGPGDRPWRLVPQIRACVDDPDRTLTVTTGNHDWVYVSDVVEALLTVARAPKSTTQGDIVHIGTGLQHRNVDVVRVAQRVTGRHIQIAEVDTQSRAQDPACWVADPRHARERYGIVAQVSLEEGLRRALCHDARPAAVASRSRERTAGFSGHTPRHDQRPST